MAPAGDQLNRQLHSSDTSDTSDTADPSSDASDTSDGGALGVIWGSGGQRSVRAAANACGLRAPPYGVIFRAVL